MDEKQYIIFTDLKDFTYKNSLLTDKQIWEILKIFHDIVTQAANKHNIKIIKSIWDAYLCVSQDSQNTFLFTQELISESGKYDEKKRIDISKISLRSTITYGHISKNMSLDLEDYFWEAINLWARIMDITPAGQIFANNEAKRNLEKLCEAKYLGDFSFHGILEEVPLFSLTEISDEEIKRIKNRDDSTIMQCEDVVFRSSCVAAILSLQPLPFLENFNLVALHLYMILRISAKFEREISLRESSKIFSELVAPLGLSYAAFQGSASAIKILLPWLGWYLFAPLSFAVSYALWKVYIMYFYYAASGENISAEIIKDLFKKHKKEGKRLAKERENDIIKIGKKYSEEVLHIGKQKDFEKVQQDTIRMLRHK